MSIGAKIPVPEATLRNQDLRGLESHIRSLVKSLSYRIYGFVITGSIVWLITKEVTAAVSVGVADALLKLGLYYLHERVWDRFSFGRRGRQDINYGKEV